jgi:hypothetical protein
LIVPHCDTQVFQLFLDTIAREAPASPGRKVMLVLPRFSSLLEAMLASDPTLVHAISDAGLHGFPLE